ncbi:hypothetical protein F5888DRAFT_1801920 [Russula emetica]|nr:hypothetical protein F5888DRAFT_1801920 [Russula emetica]
MSPPPYEYPEDPSPQLEIIRKYYAFLSAFDFDNLSTLMTDDFTQQTAPLSLGVPKNTKSDFLAFLRQYQANLKGQHLDAKLGIRNIEVIYLFQFGTGVNALKIVSVTGFTDSNRYMELHPE